MTIQDFINSHDVLVTPIPRLKTITLAAQEQAHFVIFTGQTTEEACRAMYETIRDNALEALFELDDLAGSLEDAPG